MPYLLSESKTKLMLNLNSDNAEIKTQIDTASLSQRIKLLNDLLNEFNGHYFECEQKYTDDPNDKVDYESAYAAAIVYLNFIQALNKNYFNENENLKEKYENYIFYGKICLFTVCKPPHPSSRAFTPIS